MRLRHAKAIFRGAESLVLPGRLIGSGRDSNARVRRLVTASPREPARGGGDDNESEERHSAATHGSLPVPEIGTAAIRAAGRAYHARESYTAEQFWGQSSRSTSHIRPNYRFGHDLIRLALSKTHSRDRSPLQVLQAKLQNAVTPRPESSRGALVQALPSKTRVAASRFLNSLPVDAFSPF